MSNKKTGSSVLDRAATALRTGGKTKKSTIRSNDKDELDEFLSSFARKTGGKGASKPLATLSDISISSEDDSKTLAKLKVASHPTNSNKFLKSTKTEKQATVAKYSQKMPQQSLSVVSQVQSSPALLRLSQQTQKFLKKSNSHTSSIPQQSASITISSDASESETQQTTMRFLKSKQAPQAIESGTADDALSKVVRSYHHPTAPVVVSVRTSTEDESDMAAYIQGLSTDASFDSEKPTPRPSKAVKQTNPPIKEVPVHDESSFATETFSSASSISEEKPKAEKRNLSHQVSASNDYTTDIETASEGPVAHLMDIGTLEFAAYESSPPTKSIKKPSSKTDTKKPNPVSKVFSTIGLMSVDDLVGTSQDMEASIKTNQSSQMRHYDKSESSIRTDKTESIKTNSISSVRSPTGSSIHTYQDSVKTASIESEIKTHTSTNDVETNKYESDFENTLRETDSIRTDKSSRSSSAGSYSTRSRSYSRFSSRSRSSSPSRSHSKSSDTEFHRSRQSRRRSSPYSRTDTTRSRSSSRSASSPSYTASNRSFENKYSESFEDDLSGEQTNPTNDDYNRSSVPKPVTSDASIQTGLDLEDMILKYYWMTDQAIPPPTGKNEGTTPIREPSRIAGTAVSNEALEVLTTFNPSVLALNDMIRQQLDLNKQFLSMQKEVHQNIMSAIERNYHYTTLEDTKQYIEKKRKPRLTFEEALALVEEEMRY